MSTGFRATFGKETAELLKSHSTSVPLNGLRKVLKTPLLIMADQATGLFPEVLYLKNIAERKERLLTGS